MTELKDGMKVRGSYFGRVFYDGFIYTDSNEDFFIRSAEIFQDIAILEPNLNNHSLQLFTIEDDELVVREGDVIINNVGEKYYILGVVGCIVHISFANEHKKNCYERTFHELHTRGFKIVTDKPETIQIDGKTYKKSDIDNLTPIN